MDKYLLSICIPTYNRSKILDNTLTKLFSNPDFDFGKIEVIVSDNCSTDDTALIVAKFPFAKYFCNTENVRDANFSIALNYATGTYIRLFNDTISFKHGRLHTLLKRIESALDSNQNVFFYDNTYFNKNSQRLLNGTNEYAKEVSFYATWIANFGSWRKDFRSLKDKDKYVKLQLVQVDWSYQIAQNGKKTIIYFDELFEIEEISKKGGYNIFRVFVTNYLQIIKGHQLSFAAYELEKYRLCHHFIYPWLLKLFVSDQDNLRFETRGVFSLLLWKYWYEPYFYVIGIKFFLHKIKPK
jgi:abequosyltransferase